MPFWLFRSLGWFRVEGLGFIVSLIIYGFGVEASFWGVEGPGHNLEGLRAEDNLVEQARAYAQ